MKKLGEVEHGHSSNVVLAYQLHLQMFLENARTMIAGTLPPAMATLVGRSA